jgi:drug/metabolite transporter (DMT)-like permease
MFLRFIILAGLLLLWNRRFPRDAKLSNRDRLACAAMGITYFVGIGSYLMSVAYMPVTLAVIIFYTFPILTALAHALLQKRRPRAGELLALFIAFTGLVIALDVQTQGTQLVGILFAATASIGIMLNMLGSGRLLQRIPTTLFAFYQAFSVCLLSALAMAVSGGLALPETATGNIYLGVMLLAFLIAYICTYNAIRMVGPVNTSAIMNLEPLATIVFAVILLSELLTWNQAIGGAIVLVGIVLAQRQS